MTSKQGVPERQPAKKPVRSGKQQNLADSLHPPTHPVSDRRVRRSQVVNELGEPVIDGTSQNGSQHRTQSKTKAKTPTHAVKVNAAGPTLNPRQPSATKHPKPRGSRFWNLRLKWLSNWKLWLVLTSLGIVGSGVMAALVLLRIPGMPNCPAIFWPLASASLRFECARLAASKQTAKDLLEAIALVDSLPPNHSMRAEADRLVEQWSKDVLKLADEDFNMGKLAEAIAAARRISPKASAYKLVEEHIKRWQSIWAEAEAIYKKAEDDVRAQNFRQAFSRATQLLDVDNKFWQTVKYDELTGIIRVAKDDATKLGRANRLADEGGIKNLLEAVKLVESIGPESYIYQAAQNAIPRFGRRMLEMAQAALDRRDLKEAQDILNQIPDKANLQDEVQDFSLLATAQSLVWQNTVPSVEDAIAQAQRISPNSPLYQKAQQLISRWQFEIAAIAQLEKARAMAQSGSIEDLNAGIAEASAVSRSNPRWGEAQAQIKKWKDQIESIEDRPILDMADQIAAPGDLDSLQAAISQASQVRQGRALYGEARSKIQQWTAQIQRTQDQPILDQARAYAKAGDLRSAVSVAQQIRSGRSLYNEAQADINRWRDRLQADAVQAQAQQTMQEARKLANSGSPTNLASAIQVADQVPASSKLRSEANNAINEWSQQLLQVARTQASYDPVGAITIAQRIPSRANVYSEAQQFIQSLKQQTRQ